LLSLINLHNRRFYTFNKFTFILKEKKRKKGSLALGNMYSLTFSLDRPVLQELPFQDGVREKSYSGFT
jgi:hypothetical protein